MATSGSIPSRPTPIRRLGDRRVDQIDTPEILKALSPIWLTKQETARRVRQRIGTVLDWAKAAGYRTGNNPVDEISKACRDSLIARATTQPCRISRCRPYPDSSGR